MDFGGFGLPLWRNCVNETIGILLTICFFSLKSGDALWFSFYFCAMKLMEMKKPNFPTATPDLLERLYKKGVIWIVLAIVFFTVHSSGSYLFRAASSLCFVGFVMLLVIFINKVLIEYFLTRHKVVIFILLSVLSLPVWAAASISVDVCLLHFIDRKTFSEIFTFLYIFVPLIVRLIWFLAIFALVLIFYYQRKENEEKVLADNLRSEKLDMELRYLKSQINPHFLFNALNNIYSMVYTHDDNAADSVLKLSEMLRYVLVDCQAEVIPLSKEINYIDNYIDFQMMRMGGRRDVYFDKDVEKEDFLIVPMLLQPIIENCFKYSRLESHPDGYVHISVFQKDNNFCFVAENTVAENAKPHIPNAEEKKSGIGQKNVQQRLMLYYGENYIFDIEQDKGIYKVKIEL